MTGRTALLAEQTLLGCLLADNAAYPDAAAIVAPRDCVHGHHSQILAAIGALVARSQPADVLGVFEALQRADAPEGCGLDYLNELACSVPSGSGAVKAARLVADHAQRRRLLALADGIPALVRDADTAEAALDALQAQLGALERPGSRKGPRALAEVASEYLADLQARARGEVPAGWPTQLPPLDKILGGGLRPGHVYVVAARTSTGKTSLAMQIMLALAAGGQPGLFLSQEMRDAELYERALANWGGVRMDALKLGQLTTDDWAAVPGANDALGALPLWLDDQPALRLVDIAAKARQVKRDHGLKALAIDYLQLCAAEGVKGQNRHHQIEAISRGIKALAKELGVSVLLLSQLSRGAEEGEPELHHLKESGATEEDADTVLLLFGAGNEPDGRMTVCVKVAKNRGGPRGRLALAFDGKHQHWAPSRADVSPRTRGGGQ